MSGASFPKSWFVLVAAAVSVSHGFRLTLRQNQVVGQDTQDHHQTAVTSPAKLKPSRPKLPNS